MSEDISGESQNTKSKITFYSIMVKYLIIGVGFSFVTMLALYFADK